LFQTCRLAAAFFFNAINFLQSHTLGRSYRSWNWLASQEHYVNVFASSKVSQQAAALMEPRWLLSRKAVATADTLDRLSLAQLCHHRHPPETAAIWG